MPSNDEVVFGIPSIQCPSCQSVMDISKGRIDKYSKKQRKQLNSADGCSTTSQRSYSPDPWPTGEDAPSTMAEKNFIVVSCGNMHCEQYNTIKILPIPRIAVASAKVNLND